MNREVLIERVKHAAVKAGLENLAQTAVSEVQHGVIALVSEVLRDLICVS